MEGFLSLLSGMEMFGHALSIGTLMLRIGAAVFIGAMIGIDREIKNRPAGMRTHVLVCVGAALFRSSSSRLWRRCCPWAAARPST